MKHIYIFIITIIGLTSCQEPITIKLKPSDSKIVIEATCSALQHATTVSISHNATYFGTDSIKMVDNATVTLAFLDTSINLQNMGKGFYYAPLLPNQYYQTYTISVLTSGVTYKASSTMNHKVGIDSVRVEQEKSLFGGRGNSSDSLFSYDVKVYFKDPVGKNYYKCVLTKFKNGVPIIDNSNTSEEVFNNLLFVANVEQVYTIRAQFSGGERAQLELMSIDLAAYDYFNTLNATMDAAGGTFSVPNNPQSNFTNDALGYFNACAVRSKIIVIP